ncbi:MAG: penicillin-binding protein 2, partial [Gammaproteobacteria bacterium]|nr:penicillin-binding protein 2 [Gammaproteobacteria bacterium]
MAPDLSIKDRLSEHQAFVSRALAVFTVAVLLVGGLVVRMIQLQVWEHDVYRTRSDENRIQVQPLAPPRGLIYDRNGVLLADNRPVFSLELVRERIDDLTAFIEELNTMVAISEEDISGFYDRLKRR